jgi:VanZ family protein
MAVIFTLSSISGLRVSDDAEVDRPFRVLAHLGSYALLAALLLYAVVGLRRPRSAELVLAYAITVIYGLSDEIHQSFVPNRTGQVDDLAVDAIGGAIGIAVAYAVLTVLASRWAAGRRP